MTWYFDPTKETFDLYDHEGTLVASGVEFSGSWSDPPGYQQAVLDQMSTMARDYYATNGWDGYLLAAMADVWFGQIEEGTPL